MSHLIAFIEANHKSPDVIGAIINLLGYYVGLDWSFQHLENCDELEEYLLQQIIQNILDQKQLLDELALFSGDLNQLQTHVKNIESSNASLASCMWELRKTTCRILSDAGYSITTAIGQLNILLDHWEQLFQLRDVSYTAPLQEELLISPISNREKKIAQKVETIVSQLGWQKLPKPEREMSALLLSHYFYSTHELEAGSYYVVSAIEAGVRSSLIYYNYFMLGLEAKEFSAALQGYNMMLGTKSEFEIVPPAQYQIQGIIAKTPYYTLFNALDVANNRPVFIQQWLNPPATVRTAIQSVCKLVDYEGILAGHEWIEKNPLRPVLVTELVTWPTLSKFFCDNIRLPSTPALNIMKSLLETMAICHKQGIIHGAILPNSILISPPQIKITNFGLWTWLTGWIFPTEQSSLVYAHFLPPEIYTTQSAIPTTMTDVYSLGQMLGYIWTGTTLFHTAEKRIPDLLLSLIQKATATEPSQRYASAQELYADFQKVSDVMSRNKENTVIVPLADIQNKIENKQVASERMVKIAGSNPVVLPERFIYRDGVVYCQNDSSMMFIVPCGFFMMGSSEFEMEGPVHETFLSNFLMDKHPITNAQYSRFLEQIQYNNHIFCHPQEPPHKDHTPKYWGTDNYRIYSGTEDSPVIFVDWWDAYAYANWAGKILPTESQWEKSARGSDGRHYPWGDDFPDQTKANYNHHNHGVTPVGKFSQASPYGCLDIAGNVWEWCLDYYDKNFYAQSPRENPCCNTVCPLRVTRGGAWNSPGTMLRTTIRNTWLAHARTAYIGFRCAKLL